MFLDVVIREKKEKVKEWKTRLSLSELKDRISEIKKRPFYESLSCRGSKDARIIAEIKKASPSSGVLRQDFNLKRLVSAYNEGGATAISVITEENHFHGSLSFLQEARGLTKLPLLRKDFIVDEYEIYQAKAYGADAVLLISETLEKTQLEDYTALAAEIGIDVLIEVHSLKAYEKLIDIKRFLLGINNRDLFTLKIDLAVSEQILKHIPEEQPVVIESGIKTRKDIEYFLNLGVSNFLIGTSLVLSEDPSAMLKNLKGFS